MRKPDLAAEIADKADIPLNKANDVLSAILDEITNSLSRQESVSLVRTIAVMFSAGCGRLYLRMLWNVSPPELAYTSRNTSPRSHFAPIRILRRLT